MPVARFEMPDGRVARFEVPEGTTPEQAHSLISAQIQQPESSLAKDMAQGAGNLAAGLVRGAGSIGATLLAPVDIAKDALAGKGLSLDSNRERRAKMDAGLQSMGAEPDSFMYQAGKLGGEVAGTAGTGGILANGARFAGAAPALVNSIRTGGIAAGPGANMGVRLAGGAITGAGTSAMVDPRMAGTGAVIGAATPVGVKVAGSAGNALSNALGLASDRLMQSAIKPTIAQLRTGDAATAVKALLDYGINPTKAGVNKLRELISGLNDDISTTIGSSNATIDKGNVLAALAGVRDKFGRQVSPTSDLKAIQGVADDFAAHPNFPGADIPVQAAQEMKQGTYKILSKKYGQVGNAETEAQKGLARGLKDEINKAVPGVQALNAEESRLITTLNVAERRSLMEMNKNPLGLAALTIHEPTAFAAFMADKSALFKSLAARMVNNAATGAGASGKLLASSASNPLLRAAGTVAIEKNP